MIHTVPRAQKKEGGKETNSRGRNEDAYICAAPNVDPGSTYTAPDFPSVACG